VGLAIGLNIVELFEFVLVFAIEIKCHFDWSSTMSWSVLIVIITSNLAWFIGGLILSKAWLEQFIEPEEFWVHACFTAVVVKMIDRVIFFKWLRTGVAAWIGWLWLVQILKGLLSWVEKSVIFSNWDS